MIVKTIATCSVKQTKSIGRDLNTAHVRVGVDAARSLSSVCFSRIGEANY